MSQLQSVLQKQQSKDLDHVLDEIIELKQAKIEDFNHELDILRSTKEREEVEANTKLAIIKQNIANVEQEFNDKLKKRPELDEMLQSRSKELRKIQQDIDSQTKYLKSQEKLIKEAEEEGNQQLLELQDICYSLEDTIKKLKSEEVTMAGLVSDKRLDYTELEANFATLKEDTEAKSLLFKSDLEAIEAQIKVKTKEFKDLTAEYDHKMMLLHEKEESLMVKLNMIRQERQDLDTDKRRWQSKKSLYEL